MAAPIPAAATPSTGGGGPKLETPEELDLDPEENMAIPAEALRLHDYLKKLDAMKKDYRMQRPWIFSISNLRLVNQGDTALSLFVNFAGGWPPL